VKNKNVNDLMISDFTPQEINIFIMNRFFLFGVDLQKCLKPLKKKIQFKKEDIAQIGRYKYIIQLLILYLFASLFL
jgi:hypothetical protein